MYDLIETRRLILQYTYKLQNLFTSTKKTRGGGSRNQDESYDIV